MHTDMTSQPQHGGLHELARAQRGVVARELLTAMRVLLMAAALSYGTPEPRRPGMTTGGPASASRSSASLTTALFEQLQSNRERLPSAVRSPRMSTARK
jgi:hypothetical protein